ncbi:MAG TPA: DEAD/DEAH box helicase [Acidimicrobiales bacterium]|nr:DEAD/DEAH box helicase [Acidimicrobiales bacterium]
MTPAIRDHFLASLGFEPDPFQLAAFEALDEGRSVLVAAPTGSGKTVVAEYAIAKAVDAGQKAFYTTPLKALSNQKFGDLARAYGPGRVGLLTGDNAINGNAPVVVMTTEVLRNMIYAGAEALEGLRYVVLDEVHYLQNPYRGAVWEEVIVHLPLEVDLVCLSATVSNAEEFAAWVQTVRGSTRAVIEERRPVDLANLYMVGDRSAQQAHLLPTFVDGRPNPEATALDSRNLRRRDHRGRSPGGRLYTPRRAEVVEILSERSMLPAIYFIFSRAACDDAVRQCVQRGLRLTTAEERRRIRAIVQAKVEPLTDRDLAVLGYGAWLSGLEAGFAAHHAGLVPPFKEAVESCFSAALVKVVFATETLSLGINMPARSVAIEKLSKYNGESHEPLTPGEYTQLTGRAGRRGLDEQGFAVVLWSPFVPFEQVAGLASTRTYALSSSFRPTYNMAANLVRRYAPDSARHLLNLSFAQYRTDAEVVRMETQLERADKALAAAGEDATRERRARRDVDRLEHRIKGRAESLARQFDRVLRLLQVWGYVEAWSLTGAGERLVRIYHECDLLVAECVGAGLLDGLDPAELAGLASVFTFEQRKPGAVPAPRFPSAEVRRRWLAIEEISQRLIRAEEEAALPATRPPDPGFLAAAYAWAAEDELEEVLAGEEMSGGDFVRNVKQLIDLLRQLADVVTEPATAEAARLAADRLFRGVVAASSVVAATPVTSAAPSPAN